MGKLDIFIKEAQKNGQNWIYVENLLDKNEYTYKELITLLAAFYWEVDEDVLVKCQICSEQEIDFSNLDTLLSTFVDTEWDEPRIEFDKNLVWYPQNSEKIIKIADLPDSLVAVYSSNPEYCLTIMSREVYDNRVVSNEVQSLLNTISYGDIKLEEVEKDDKNKEFKKIISYLIKSEYVFVVYKDLVNEAEDITLESFIDWEQKEKYSIEFTKKGRKCYAKNELGIDVMRFICKAADTIQGRA